MFNLKNLKFYKIDYNYIKHLQNIEIETRGFTRVPNLDYGKDRKQKFVCGIVLNINNINYFAPITSFKSQKPDNFLICNSRGKVLSSIRFNYMFPVPIEIAQIYNFNDISDEKYKNLVRDEFKYCLQFQDDIKKLAQRTYKRVILGKNKGLVHNSCDFKLLEQACKKYTTNSKNIPEEIKFLEITKEELQTLKLQGFSFISGNEIVHNNNGYILKIDIEKAKQVQKALANKRSLLK